MTCNWPTPDLNGYQKYWHCYEGVQSAYIGFCQKKPCKPWMATDTQTQSRAQTRCTDMQGADMKWRPSCPVDRVVPGGGALPCSLLLGCYFGLLCLDAFRAVEHHLNHSVLHQWGKAKQQASNEPDVDGLDVGHFGQLRSQGGALRGQREHRQDA